MIRNIRHIQIKKVANSSNLFKAILTYESHEIESNQYDKNDNIEYIKYLENQKNDCPHCIAMKEKRKI